MKKNSVSQAGFMTGLENECIAMMNYSFANGLIVPPEIAKSLNELNNNTDDEVSGVDKDIARAEKAEILTMIHNELSEIVRPAKPQTILLIASEALKRNPFFFLGKLPIIRKMIFVAIFSLVSLIGISLSSDICAEHVVKSMFELNGKKLLMVQAILLCSAALGASFIILHRANSYITAGTFDPKYESSYWVRLIVGLISGIILTQLIPLDLSKVGQGVAVASDDASSKAMLRVTLALLGGFSANLVYNILNRLVEIVQALLIPESDSDPLAKEQGFQDKYNEKLLKYQNKMIGDAAKLHRVLMEEGELDKSKVNDILGEFVKGISDEKSYKI